MRLCLFALGLLLLVGGCEAIQLRNRTVRQASTITDYNYQQVLNNLAMFAANPNSLPYFSLAPTGVTTIQQTATPSGMINWDYMFLGTAGKFVNHLDKKDLALSLNQQNIETWNTVTCYYPQNLKFMQCAYRKAVGVSDCQCDTILQMFFYPPPASSKDHNANKVVSLGQPKSDDQELHSPKRVAPQDEGSTDHVSPVDRAMKDGEYQSIRPGWFGVGCLTDVPRKACYVGHFGHKYVWVMPEGMATLSDFTLAILDIATSQPAQALSKKLFYGENEGIQHYYQQRQIFPQGYQSVVPAPPG